jgi:hypothetical protein
MGRLSIDIDERQHQQIKAMAALQGKSIRDFVVERVLPPLPASTVEEGEDTPAWQAFRSLMQDRIAEADTGAISERTFQEIFDAVQREIKAS